MNDPQNALTARFADALAAAFGPEFRDTDPILRAAQNPKFGDYQANVAMPLGKKLGKNPREVAAAILEKLQLADLCEPLDKSSIAGPGFINLKLRADYLSRVAAGLYADPRLGVAPASPPQTVVIDYSSPNVAKEMHVGHLRSTVIGDALARTLEFLGHHVIRQNHLGDWGTQFGMLIEFLNDSGAATSDSDISDLNSFYQQAKKKFDSDTDFADRARKRVVALQSGDSTTLALWRKLVEQSKHHFNDAYRRLDITLADSDVRGESFFNGLLQPVVADLESKGLSQISDGAVCVFVPGHQDPLMVRKTDGGFGYAATDLAAIRFRVTQLHAQRIIYVVDARQSDHFSKLFHAAQSAGWLGEHCTAEHVKFGTILGEDNRPFKTRSGDTVRLADLLNEAEERAEKIVREKAPDMDPAEAKAVAHVVGIGAVKYGDLAADRVKDYVFSWDRMLAMDGNTAPYLQYAHARIRSIFRKAGGDWLFFAESAEQKSACPPPTPIISHPAERSLVLKLVQFSSVVRAVADRLEPHHMCTWLYELAAAYSSFYESCPVLKADSEEQKTSRLLLCDLTSKALRQGLNLLGISVPDRM